MKPGKFELCLAFLLLVGLTFLIGAAPRRGSKRRELWKIGRTTTTSPSTTTTTTTTTMIIKKQCNIEECCKKMAHTTCPSPIGYQNYAPDAVLRNPVYSGKGSVTGEKESVMGKRKYSPTLAAVRAFTTPPPVISSIKSVSSSVSTKKSGVTKERLTTATTSTTTRSPTTTTSTSTHSPTRSPTTTTSTSTRSPTTPTSRPKTMAAAASTKGFLSKAEADALLISKDTSCSCFEPSTALWTNPINLTDLLEDYCPRRRKARSVMEPLPTPVYCSDEVVCNPFYKKSRECVDYIGCTYPCGDTRACKIVPIEPDEYGNCLEWTCKHQGHDDTPEEISEISSIAGAIFGAISLMITCMYILMKKFKWRIGRRGLYRKLSEETEDPDSGHPLDDAINSGDNSVQEGNNNAAVAAANNNNAAGNNGADAPAAPLNGGNGLEDIQL